MALKANYETVMVFSMKQGEDGIQALIEKFKALIEKHATLQSVDEWGKRKLAYLINKEAEGYYVLMNFESEAEFPAELDRIYKITDGVIRSLIIRKPEGAEIPAAKEAEEAPAEEAPVEEAPAEEAPVVEEAPAEEAPAAEEAAE
jgi:small subunit ribosomal protein S6